METWTKQVERDAVAGHDARPIGPEWDDGGVPFCDDSCAYHDGKRCELLGSRPDWICQPAVRAMASRLTKAPR
jgi:hypothetical protein